jgi:hypothetical protein
MGATMMVQRVTISEDKQFEIEFKSNFYVYMKQQQSFRNKHDRSLALL